MSVVTVVLLIVLIADLPEKESRLTRLFLLQPCQMVTYVLLILIAAYQITRRDGLIALLQV